MNGSIKINKRHIVIASILLALGTALGINYWFSPELHTDKNIQASSLLKEKIEESELKNDQKKDVEKIGEYFTQKRSERKENREQIMKIASDDEKLREKMMNKIIQENSIEELISAKMDENIIDCIALIGEDGCNVILGCKSDLSKEIVYKIKDIVKNQTNFSNNEIKIIEKR